MKQKDSITSIISPLVRPGPTEVSYKNMRFLIMDRPTDSTLSSFLEELKKRNIRDVVRACEPTYRTDILEKEGIQVHDLQFADGFPPPQHIIDQWFELCRTRFREDSNACIAVHCVAGLGRAPVLVALALIELGMPYEDSVDLIRQKRRGAINARQLSYLAEYRPKSRLKVKYRQTNGCLLQ